MRALRLHKARHVDKHVSRKSCKHGTIVVNSIVTRSRSFRQVTKVEIWMPNTGSISRDARLYDLSIMMPAITMFRL